ncbi:putative transport-related membrane protein [Pedobacter sp. BAL39]|uniref:MFS transporter n=1 Tax=Pedobacter sp. BAL39 TaxID=391596 RepID=UPI000155A024|nr:MFS transporter [Pedobacter sp. BAL39]EDM36592.1 putative transport-related membrane protein [Pedobacter sp. BAL39]
MSNPTSIFKKGLPEWLIRFSILFLLLAAVLLFAISTADGAAAAGFYGMEPADVQFSLLLFYAAIASFAGVERRFFERVVTKDYLLISVVLELLITYACYHTREVWLVFVFRFLQGIVNCGINSICLNLLFGRLKSEHAREIGYTIFYALILCVSPVTALFSVPIVENFEYNVLYKAIIFCFLPGAALMYSLLNRVHVIRRKPLYQLDWSSFVLFAVMLVLIAFVLVYGQEKDWLESEQIVYSIMAIALLGVLNVMRQYSLRRPTVDLAVFRYRNFSVGIVFLVILYLIRGAFSLTSSYFITILGMDSLHANVLMIYNILGIALGSFIAIRFLIRQQFLRVLWISGFSLLMVFFMVMCFLFSSEAGTGAFIIPLFLQGLGAGMVMCPIVMFIVSSVPVQLGQSAASVGVLVRFSSFSISLALINLSQLYFKGLHGQLLGRGLSVIDLGVSARLSAYQQALANRGMLKDEAAKAAVGLLNKSLQKQEFLQFCINYYEWIAILCALTILLIGFQPVISRTIINLKGKHPAPAGF